MVPLGVEINPQFYWGKKNSFSMTSQRDHASRIGKKNENTNKQKNTPYSAFETEYGVLFADQTLSDRCAFRII